jgi:hypothetical protein
MPMPPEKAYWSRNFSSIYCPCCFRSGKISTFVNYQSRYGSAGEIDMIKKVSGMDIITVNDQRDLLVEEIAVLQRLILAHSTNEEAPRVEPHYVWTNIDPTIRAACRLLGYLPERTHAMMRRLSDAYGKRDEGLQMVQIGLRDLSLALQSLVLV